MLLKIDIKWDTWHFYWSSNWIDLGKWEIYKSNILPCKTTILGMLCYYYWVEFDNLDINNKKLKYTFIEEFKYWIRNNSNNLDKETKMYTSKFHRTIWWRQVLFIKEYTKNINLTLYILIKDNSLLLEYIKKSILDNNLQGAPWLWDKNLIPEIFNVEILLENNKNLVNNFNWKLLTNIFELKGEYLISLWEEKKEFLLSFNRINYNNNKKDFIVWMEEYGFDFNVKDEDILVLNNKWILLY